MELPGHGTPQAGLLAEQAWFLGLVMELPGLETPQAGLLAEQAWFVE